MNLQQNSQILLDVKSLGQVFTPESIVKFMVSLKKNVGLSLEPSRGAGAFDAHLPEPWLGIEIDRKFRNPNVLNMDFFAFRPENKIPTIIGNPPYVKYSDIGMETKALLDKSLFDKRSNLYLFFIHACVEMLEDGGELIFIVPRDFLKVTSSARLNNWLFRVGNFSHFVELGDAKIFEDATPNVAIFRFVKGEKHRSTRYFNLGSQPITIFDSPDQIPWENREFTVAAGQIVFSTKNQAGSFSDYFYVKVGAVSGADPIFVSDEFGDTEFVYSKTYSTGKPRKMIFQKHVPYLDQYKEQLIGRKIRTFTESNWWEWGRGLYVSNAPRIYVNQRTRHSAPFFLNDCKNFDGSILGIFPKYKFESLESIVKLLNRMDWQGMGFVVDGRFIFTQRSLENCPIDSQTLAELEGIFKQDLIEDNALKLF